MGESVQELRRMPDGFLWGAATAAHQVEGDNRHSDWWAAEVAGLVPACSLDACDHRRRFESDLDMMADAGLTAYRFSVEWARIEPNAGHWRSDELDVYLRMAEACRERGIHPLVNLHHFSLPDWAAKRGGWLWSDMVPTFAEYARRIVSAFGDRVHLYATVNEPVVLALNAYLDGLWPPKHRSLPQALLVARREAMAHRRAYEAIHAERPGVAVGVAKHVLHFRPLDPRRILDRGLASTVGWIFNDAWLEAVRDHLDWVGINYYTTHYCTAGLRRDGVWPALIRARERAQTEMGWEIHPEGLRHVLRHVGRFGLPVYITENGIATTDDRQRRHFIQEHLLAAAQAIADGVDLRGYFHWSLLDNFEWAEGYSMHFGLVGVERQTQERDVRPSLGYLGAMARAGRVLHHEDGRDRGPRTLSHLESEPDWEAPAASR